MPPGTLACVQLDCPIRVYSLMFKRICLDYVTCMWFDFGFFFYIIGKQKNKILNQKNGRSSKVDSYCQPCAGCSCDGVKMIQNVRNSSQYKCFIYQYISIFHIIIFIFFLNCCANQGRWFWRSTSKDKSQFCYLIFNQISVLCNLALLPFIN